MGYIAGSFSATYHGRNLGLVDRGFQQIISPIYEMIQTDVFRGDVDGIFQGMNMMIRTVLTEADLPSVQDLIWPWDGDADGTIRNSTSYSNSDPGDDTDLAELETEYGAVGPSGVLLSAFAKPLVLTPCPGTTAKTRGKLKDITPYYEALTSITFPKVVIAADPVTLDYSASHRKIPVSLIVLPYDGSSGGDITANVPGAMIPCGPKRFFIVT
jgi:hypothetical protein